MKGVPWHSYRGDEYQDGEVPEGVEVEEKKKTDEKHPERNTASESLV